MNVQELLSQTARLADSIDPHQVNPNPRVGCLVVQNNKIISEGAHEFFGGPHAEVNALKNHTSLNEAQVFISLEPCHTFPGKKTPSCSQLLLNLKPKKVWVGALDPQFKGENIKSLRSKGLDIEYVSNKDCAKVNPFFRTWITQKRPYITLKIAQSLNGKITSTNQHITSQLSRQEVHRMRAHHAAILTTTKTVLEDDPRLDIRLKTKLSFSSSNPKIIIVGKTKLPESLNIFQIPDREIYQLESLDELHNLCLENSIDSVMTECGSEMNTQLIQKKLVDEVCLFTAPIFLQKNEKPSFAQEFSLEEFQLIKSRNFESDICLNYRRS